MRSVSTKCRTSDQLQLPVATQTHETSVPQLRTKEAAAGSLDMCLTEAFLERVLNEIDMDSFGDKIR